MDIKPIETLYNGYRFRSRLEARWAVFFDALGIKYEYEKEGFELKSSVFPGQTLYYLPDFYLPEQNCWIEIKPTDSLTDDEIIKYIIFGNFNPNQFCLLTGVPKIDGYVGKHYPQHVQWGICPITKRVGLYVRGNWSGEESIECNSCFCRNECTAYGNANGAKTNAGRYHGGSCFSLNGVSIFNGKELKKAYNRATSARFEHGCSGGV